MLDIPKADIVDLHKNPKGFSLNLLHPLNSQLALFDAPPAKASTAFRSQLLKWIGNKQRFAYEIISFFPTSFGTYFEPFLGSGGVLGTLAPGRAIATDCFPPLMEIWRTLHDSPDIVKRWYTTRWKQATSGVKHTEYETIKARYNARPNGADLLFLCRACYGGVVRFRKDGYMSTPCGVHDPIPPEAFARRVNEWHMRTKGTRFLLMEYEEAMLMAKPGDLIYCDPPYSHSQAILYGAQNFSLLRLLETIRGCKDRGVRVALSIDGSKRSGDFLCDVPMLDGLFEREVFLTVGRSMLKRFQMGGKSLQDHVVADRLLLTY